MNNPSNYPNHVFPKSGGSGSSSSGSSSSGSSSSGGSTKVDSCKDKCGKKSGKCYCDPGCKK